MLNTITIENAGQLAEKTRAGRGWITEIRWSPNSQALAVAASTGVALYALDDGLKLRALLEGHSGHVKSAAVCPDGKQIASASADTTSLFSPIARCLSGQESEPGRRVSFPDCAWLPPLLGIGAP